MAHPEQGTRLTVSICHDTKEAKPTYTHIDISAPSHKLRLKKNSFCLHVYLVRLCIYSLMLTCVCMCETFWRWCWFHEVLDMSQLPKDFARQPMSLGLRPLSSVCFGSLGSHLSIISGFYCASLSLLFIIDLLYVLQFASIILRNDVDSKITIDHIHSKHLLHNLG